MPVGLEVCNPDGSVLFGPQQRLLRFLSSISIPASASGGSHYDARLAEAGAEPFWYSNASMYDGGVDISFSAGTMSWTRRLLSDGRVDQWWSGVIYYGLF